MRRAADVWAELSDSERADFALETAHLPRAYELLRALDRDLADRPRPLLGPDDQGDCEACNHLVVSHQDDGCHAELRTSTGIQPCPCQLARWEVERVTSPSSSDGAS